jgi:hypothetical protein
VEASDDAVVASNNDDVRTDTKTMRSARLQEEQMQNGRELWH